MEEFGTLNDVKALFKKQGIKESDNNVYVTLLKDLRKYSGMVSGMEYPYMALVICFTEEGIGYFYLKQPKFSLRLFVDKLVVDHESYTFLSNDDIKSIEVKRFALLDKKRRSVIIKTNNKKTHFLYGYLEDELLEYNNDAMSKLIDKYQKK